jgi:hypothetical protein
LILYFSVQYKPTVSDLPVPNEYKIVFYSPKTVTRLSLRVKSKCKSEIAFEPQRDLLEACAMLPE